MKKFTLCIFLILSIAILSGCTSDNKIKVSKSDTEPNDTEKFSKDLSFSLDLSDTSDVDSSIEEVKNVSNQYKDIKKELDKNKEIIEQKVDDTILGHSENVSGTLKELINK